MTKEDVLSFINFQYRPLTKDYTTQMLGITWTASMLSSLAYPAVFVFLCLYFILNLVLTIFTKKVLLKDKRPCSKFLFDGICWTYISIVILIASYFLLTFGTKGNLVIILVMFAIEVGSIIFTFFIVKYLIKKGAYKNQARNNTPIYISLISAGLSAVVARVMIAQLPDVSPFLVIAICMMVIAIILSSLSVNFLKFYYYNKLFS